MSIHAKGTLTGVTTSSCFAATLRRVWGCLRFALWGQDTLTGVTTSSCFTATLRPGWGALGSCLVQLKVVFSQLAGDNSAPIFVEEKTLRRGCVVFGSRTWRLIKLPDVVSTITNGAMTESCPTFAAFRPRHEIHIYTTQRGSRPCCWWPSRCSGRLSRGNLNS